MDNIKPNNNNDINIDPNILKNGIVDFVKENDNKSFKEDEEHTIAKGDNNKDIRFNPNMNRKERDKATRENQLR